MNQLKCSHCGNEDQNLLPFRGLNDSGTYRRFYCKRCHKYGSVPAMGAPAPGSRKSLKPPKSRKSKDKYSFTDYGETAEVNFQTKKRIRTEKDVIEVIALDTNTWAIDHFKVGTSEAYRKDRKVEWKVTNGVVVNGEVHDTGKLLLETLFSVQVWLKRRTQEIRNSLAVADIKEDLKKFAPKYPKIHYPKLKDGMLYEIAAFDFHVGKQTWGEESGENSNLKTQTKRVIETFEKLLSYAKFYPIDRILIPIGGDYYNTDGNVDATTAGTPQQEDTRWQKTFRAGRLLATTLIDMCSTIAPVDVLVLTGNHDLTKTFFMGDSLQSWYRLSKDVHIDNSARARKYYQYGNSLIGFTHGSEEKVSRLPGIMAMEAAEWWAAARFREWHTGDKHREKETVVKTDEENGVVIRIIRSLTPPDAWHFQKGFVGAIQAGESFLWHKYDGQVGHFTAAAMPGEP